MAERLETLPKRGRAQQHDWDQWSDGAPWRLKRGVDFTCGVESLRTQLYGKARGLKKGVTIGEITEDTISFQMYDLPDKETDGE